MSTDQYSAYLETTGRYVTGTVGAVLAVVVAQGEYHCNEEYPAQFTPVRTSGVVVSDAAVRGTLAGKRGSLTVPLRVTSSKTASLGGELRFSVCSSERCLLEKQFLELSFEVK